MRLLDVKNLTVRFQTERGVVTAVENVSFSLDRGETMGLVGESGCGKTTLAYTIAQLLPKNAQIVEGEVWFRGRDLLQGPKRPDGSLDLFHPAMREVRWKGLSVIFQGAMNSFSPVAQVDEQIVEAILAHDDVGRAAARERVRELYRLVGIPLDRVGAYPHELSGGTRQRAMIAMALACGPDLIIADEPTTALDVILQDRILGEVARIQRERNMAMILISHDVTVVSEVSHRIGVMYAGRLVEQGTTRDILRAPAHPYTVALLDSFPSLRGRRRRLQGIPGFPPDLANPPPGCRFHPRCQFAQPGCAATDPKHEGLSATHSSACLRVPAVQEHVRRVQHAVPSEVKAN
jgi:peptide/nickel transport system ATP-binding protein